MVYIAFCCVKEIDFHYSDDIMSVMASQNTGVSIVYSTICSEADQRKHQSSALLAFCEGNSPVTGEFPAQSACNAENVSIWWRHHAAPYWFWGQNIPWPMPWLMHDDVMKWKHFPRNWPFVRGIHRSRWIPHTKASDAELWCFLWSATE